MRAEGDGARASEAADLLGVLELVDASGGSNSGSGGSVDRAIVELQNVVRLDSTNGDATLKLELASVRAAGQPVSSTRGRRTTGRRRGGASETTPGRGY